MELKNHLLKMSEAVIEAKDIIMVKTLPIEISVDLWFEKNKETDMLSISQRFQEIMEKYLHPSEGNGGRGWTIGKLPYRSQILMQLNALRDWGVIERLSVTARYEYQGEIKECELDTVKAEFSMVAVSGKHEIHAVKA